MTPCPMSGPHWTAQIRTPGPNPLSFQTCRRRVLPPPEEWGGNALGTPGTSPLLWNRQDGARGRCSGGIAQAHAGRLMAGGIVFGTPRT